MNTPIINPSSLTEEQREAIINLFKESCKGINKTPSVECGVNIGSIAMLQVLFGNDFFEKGENDESESN